MNSRARCSRFAFCAVVLAVLCGSSGPRAEEVSPGPLKDVLENTGLIWTPLEGAADSWQVSFESSEGNGTIDVYVTYNDENRQYALIFATVVDRPAEFEFGRDVLVECMRLNNDYPGIKFCLDFVNGDIDCQSEDLMSTITAESLQLKLNRVADFVDEHGAKLRGMVP